ncbi:Metallo-dependent phosphatase-like protein [Spinellus fusiger]|nr:Metallo-dependent phosphatase-like protein [Spinellus fusiger]
MPENRTKASHKSSVGGRLGTPGKSCDAPIELAQRTLDWIVKEWRDKLDFVIWTGDNSRHDWDKTSRRSRKQVYRLNQKVTDMMIDAFWPHVPVVPSLGNNDVFPANKIGDKKADEGLLSYYEEIWRHWIPEDQRKVFKQGGYFSIKVTPHLRVVSLNTLYFSSRNKAVKHCKVDTPAYRHMEWLEKELENARRNDERVYIIGHVPPSTRDYRNTCLDLYLRISSSYSDVLLGHFYGHLNMDHFLLYGDRLESNTAPTYNESEPEDTVHTNRNLNKYVKWLRGMYRQFDTNKHQESAILPGNYIRTDVVIIQVAPSVLPTFFPTVRIYRYEKNTTSRSPIPYGTLLGYDQFFANLTHWEEKQDKEPSPLKYQLEYTTEDAYGLEDLSAHSYYHLAKAMVEDSTKGNRLWSSYTNNMFVQTLNNSF